MSRVRLRVDDFDDPASPRYLYLDPVNGLQRIPVLRVVSTVLVGPDPTGTVADNRPRDQALIDTGSWLTVIQYHTWQDYDRQGLLVRMTPPIGGGQNTRSVLRIGGHQVGYELGRVWMAVINPSASPAVSGGQVIVRDRLPAVPVLAQLLTDPAVRLPLPVVLGLYHGVLEGRRLRRVPIPVTTTPNHRTDVGPRYGQAWWLEA